MDINYFSKWSSFWFFALVSLIYLYYFFKYIGFSLSPVITSTELERRLFKLLGFCHLLISLQMCAGLYYVLKLKPPIAAAHVGFSGISIILISLVKLVLLDKKCHLARLEIFLSVFGFLLLSLHIVSNVTGAF